MSAQVSDPKIVMNLMRHKSLNTTTFYTRTVTERMKAVVQSLGKPLEASLEAYPRAKILKNRTMRELLVKLAERKVELLSQHNVKESFDDVT